MLDSRTPTRKVKEFLQQQTRFKMLTKSKPEDAKRLWAEAQHDAEMRYRFYEYLAQRKIEPSPDRRLPAPEKTEQPVHDRKLQWEAHARLTAEERNYDGSQHKVSRHAASHAAGRLGIPALARN